jgi:hypothetical protein
MLRAISAITIMTSKFSNKLTDVTPVFLRLGERYVLFALAILKMLLRV